MSWYSSSGRTDGGLITQGSGFRSLENGEPQCVGWGIGESVTVSAGVELWSDAGDRMDADLPKGLSGEEHDAVLEK